MLNFILMLIAFGLMIAIHELGHFLAARACKVGIEKFSIGFGKALLHKTHNGIEYRIGWIPLGGYLKMRGENPDEADSTQDDSSSFTHKPWWQKVIVAFSGPFANLLLGFLLFVIAFMLPQKQEDLRPVIGNAEGKWTEVFMPSDSLKAVNGKSIKGFQEFLLELSKEHNNSITVSRGAADISLSISPQDVDSLIKSVNAKADNTIGEVFTGLPAWRAGLKKGDKVLAVDSVVVADWYDMRNRIISSPHAAVTLKLQRSNSILYRKIALERNISVGQQRMIGISQDLPVKSTVQYNPLQALQYGFNSTGNFIIMNYVSLYKLVGQPKELQKNLGGPVMIATISQQAGQRGFSYLLIFFASISLALMIMNLLPIPVLDGGHIMFAFVEGFIRKPVSPKVQAIAQRIGFALLLTLMVFAFYTDITKLLLRLFALRH